MNEFCFLSRSLSTAEFVLQFSVDAYKENFIFLNSFFQPYAYFVCIQFSAIFVFSWKFFCSFCDNLEAQSPTLKKQLYYLPCNTGSSSVSFSSPFLSSMVTLDGSSSKSNATSFGSNSSPSSASWSSSLLFLSCSRRFPSSPTGLLSTIIFVFLGEFSESPPESPMEPD